MRDVDATVDGAAVADINRAMERMIRETPRGVKDAVHRASYHFLVSAKAQTPEARKKSRTLQTGTQGGRPSKFYIVRRQEKPPMFIRLPNPALVKGRDQKTKAREAAEKLKARFKMKPRMKAAKNSWNKAFRELGKSAQSTMTEYSRRVMAASTARKMNSVVSPAVQITNTLNYLPKIAPMLEASALRAAGKRLFDLVDRQIEKQVKRVNA